MDAYFGVSPGWSSSPTNEKADRHLGMKSMANGANPESGVVTAIECLHYA